VIFALGVRIPLPQQKLGSEWRRANLVGHNGAGDKYPEDTLEAVQIAIHEYNVDIVEVDIQLTKDKQLVCIHDPKLDRTTNGTGYVSSYTFEELQAFDAAWKYPEYRNKGIRIPSLDAVVQYILPHKNVKMFIELKPPASLESVKAVHDMFVKYDLFDRAIVIAFEPHILYMVRRADERIGTSLIVASWLVTAGCKHYILPNGFCNAVTTLGVAEWLDWMILKASTTVIPWALGTGGFVISANSTTLDQAKEFMNQGLFVDIWGIQDRQLMKQFWQLGASIAPDVLIKRDD